MDFYESINRRKTVHEFLDKNVDFLKSNRKRLLFLCCRSIILSEKTGIYRGDYFAD